MLGSLDSHYSIHSFERSYGLKKQMPCFPDFNYDDSRVLDLISTALNLSDLEFPSFIRSRGFDNLEQITTSIKKNDVLIPKKEIKSRINAVKESLRENPLLVWDSEKTAIKIINKFEQLVDKNPWKASWLLTSRKELDTWIKSQKPNVFAWDKESALTIAVKEVRTAANNLADEKAVNVSLKTLLKRQSNLFRALENTAPKAAKEASTKIGRLMQKVQKVTWIKWELATTLWLIGWWTAAAMLPWIALWTAWAIWTFEAWKFILSATAKRELWKVLTTIWKQLKKAPWNPDLQAIKTELTDILENNK